MPVVKHSLRRRPSYTSQRTRRPRLSPIPRGGGQDLSGTYYHVHNYVHFINLVNKALALAFSNLRNLMPQNDQGATLIDLATAPYLDFDPTTNRVILHAHQFFFDEVGAAIQNVRYVQIYFNERLYDLFVGLPYEFVPLEGELNAELQTEGHV